jgi:hypothetical protein
MSLSRPKLSQQRKSDMRSSPNKGIVNVKMQVPRFITFRLKDVGKNVCNISPFYIQRTLDGVAG